MPQNRIDITVGAKGDFSSLLGDISKVKNSLSKLKLPDNISKGLDKSFLNLEKIADQYKTQMAKGFETPGDVKGLSKIFTNAKVEIDKITDYMNQLSTMDIDLKVKSDKLKEAENKLASLRAQIAGKETDLSKNLGIDKFASNIENASSKSQKLGTAVRDALSGFKSDSNVEHFVSNIEQAQKVLLSLSTTSKQNFLKNMGMDPAEVQRVSASMETLNKAVKDTFSSGVSNIQENAEGFNKLKTSADNAKVAIDNIKRAEQIDNSSTVARTAAELQKQSEAARQVAASELEAANATMSMNRQMKDLQQSTQYFFSLRNMFNLLKRGIKDAYDTIKDLDKAMTETAVVTNYSVGDMWAKLPEYTELANQLGATTQGAYETMTLYYQQGLNTAQAFALGEETIKMARIAGQDYAETTDMMTAALRGFNMELNETSAQRINDVYSNLAAKTASSTSEIGSAMERTASIAHSANMDFETTAAFLAQMIETTREAPENLGTAMKTIVARFQELKENPNEIVEVDGEEVDYNRVDKALKSIGVSLVDNQDKFRDLDDVFLDIASRWDGLSQMQQRYVATMAAGSRQQSRFIAMMNNYERTQELVSYATDSAGASNEQFNKTLDSLEAKINKLKNAWDAFLMGITNDKLVKGAVDFATGFITQINKLVDGISGKNGLVQSITSLGIAFTGLKLGGKVINALMGGLGGLIDPQSSFTSGLLKGRVGRNGQTINAIKTGTQPIVQLLREILNKPTDQGGLPISAAREQFKTGKQVLSSVGAKGQAFTYGDIKQAFANNGVTDSAMQNLVLANSSGYSAAIIQGANAAIARTNWSQPAKEVLQNYKSALQKQGKRVEIGEAFYNKQSMLQVLRQVSPDIAKQTTNEYVNQMKQAYQTQFGHTWDEDRAGAAYARRLEGKDSETAKDIQRQMSNFARNFGQQGLADPQKLTVLQKAAQGFSSIGSAATGAGMAIMQAGAALDSAGFKGAGAMLQSIGNGFMSLGMAVGGVAQAVTGIGSLFAEGGLLASIGVAPVIAGLLGVVTVVGALGFAWKKHNDQLKETKELATEVSDSYNNTIDSTSTNLSKLNEYQDRFKELSKGVDAFGNNASLEASEYDEYKQIVREIAEINPSIVEGYNAQGEAIVTNNNALEDTIKLQEEIRDKATEEYISSTSTQKLLDQLSNDLNENQLFDVSQIDEWGSSVVKKGQISKDIDKLKKSLNDVFEHSNIKQTDIESLLGISLDSLTEDTINQWDEHATEISSYIEKNAPEIAKTYFSPFAEATDQITETLATRNEMFDPLISQLKTWASEQGYEISGQLGVAFNKGIEQLAYSNPNLSPFEFHQEIADMATTIKGLNGHAQDYEDALNKIQEAQDNFKSRDSYAEEIEDSINAIISWRDEFLDIYNETGDESARIVAEMFQTQLESATTFSVSIKTLIKDAFGTINGYINDAGTAVERFNEATKQDYGTAASSMETIYDKVNGTNEKEGKGSLTFWAGAEELLNQKYWKNAVRNTEEGAKAVRGKLESIEDWFNDDAATAAGSFLKSIEDLAKDMNDKELAKYGLGRDADNKLKFDIDSNKQFKELAKLLGISDTLLGSMLNKVRQFVDVDFTNYEELNEAINGKSGEGVYTYNGKTYVRNSALREASIEQTGTYDKQKTKDSIDATVLDVPMNKLTKETAEFIDSSKTGVESIKQIAEAWTNLSYEGHEYTTDDIVNWIQKYSGDTELQNWDTADLTQIVGDSVAKAQMLIDDPALQFEEEQSDKLGQLNEKVGNIESILNPGGSNSEEGTSSENSQQAKLGNADKYLTGFGETLFNRADRNKFNNNKDLISSAFGMDLFSDSGVVSGLTTLASTLKTVDISNSVQQDIIGDYLNQNTEAIQKLDPEVQSKALTNLAGEIDQLISSGSLTPEQAQAFFSEIGIKNLDLSEAAAPLQTQVAEAIANGSYTIDVDTNIHIGDQTISAGGTSGKRSYGGRKGSIAQRGPRAQGQNNHRLGTFAQGSSGGYRIPGADTLTGEEGPELVWEPKQNRAYITGMNGPQFANISKDAVVWTAAQTRAIQRNKGFVPFKSRAEGQGTGINLGTGTLDIEGNVVKITQSEEFTVDVKANVIGGINLPQSQSVNVQVQSQTVTPDVDTSGVSSGIQSSITAAGKNGATAMSNALTAASNTAAGNIRGNIYSAIVTAGSNAASQVRSTLSGITATAKITPTLTRSVLKASGEGGSSATVSLHWSAANGMNAGSAAKGVYGNLGPKGRGGLTLLGEEGYEVLWLPSANRSMIVGKDGPQMMDLPSDAIVWDHKKSKQILSSGGIPAGSLQAGTTVSSSGWSSTEVLKQSTEVLKQTLDEGKKTAKNTDSSAKSGKDTKKASKETASNTKKIAAGEDNRKRILDAISNKLDKLSNKVSDKLEQVGTTYSDVAADIKKQVSLLTRSQKINTKVVDTYNKKLRNLDHLNKKVNIKDVGKIGNLGRFVYKDSETGAYQIDRKKLKKAYKGKKYEAVYDYLNNKINDYTSKRDEAQKNVDDAKAKLNDLTNQVKETFYDWENELTKLRNFSDKLELGDSFQSKLQAYMDMVDAKMLSGLGTVAEGAEAYRSTMQKMVSSMTTGVANATQKTAAAIEKYNKDTSLSNLKVIKQRANAEWKADRDNLKKRAAARKANEDYEAVKLAKDYISISTLPTGERTASIDWAKYEAARNGKGITDATNEAVTNYLETVIDDLKEIDDGVSDVYGRIQSLYELRTEALQTQADSAHTLISGMEAEAQEEIDKLNTINSTISNAFSELINKIRKELDRQRKLEQNEETERNISDQMNRLAMLRADTSGGNQVEIAQLERDIANARGDYEDSLEDQMLDRLQEQADEASKQREKQIKLLSAQLDQSKKTGEFVKKAEALVDAAAVGRLTPEEMADFRKYYQLANGGEDRTKYDDKLNSGSADQAMSELAGTQDTIDTVEKEVGELDKQVKIANTLDQHSGLTFSAIQDLWNDGISVKELQGLGASWKDLVKIVKDLPTLKAAGMSAKDAKANGYTAQQMKAAKYSNKDILGAGWKGVKDAKDLAKVTENGKPVYSMKQIQKTTGINAKQAYNISKANNRGTKDLAGISGKVNIDTNKKKKGIEKKGANATVGTSGKSIASNVGSTLYVYDWSNGKQGDLLAKYAINEFNAKTFKNHPKEAKQALEYAIKHGKIGDLINKDFMNLAKTAKIIGNEYTTGDKKTVSVGGDGKLYYDSDDGVRVWNPGAGKTALYKKYDNKNKKIIDSFKKKAKAKGNINREFADVLKRYGITKYASGGLASDTGLAWLDGTNSNPELILNAADTKNFIALKNVLADLSRQGIFNDSGATGNATFDIDINVDKISSDYDVDKIAARVKKVITNEAKHRNVTVMGRSR